MRYNELLLKAFDLERLGLSDDVGLCEEVDLDPLDVDLGFL